MLSRRLPHWIAISKNRKILRSYLKTPRQQDSTCLWHCLQRSHARRRRKLHKTERFYSSYQISFLSMQKTTDKIPKSFFFSRKIHKKDWAPQWVHLHSSPLCRLKDREQHENMRGRTGPRISPCCFYRLPRPFLRHQRDLCHETGSSMILRSFSKSSSPNPSSFRYASTFSRVVAPG